MDLDSMIKTAASGNPLATSKTQLAKEPALRKIITAVMVRVTELIRSGSITEVPHNTSLHAIVKAQYPKLRVQHEAFRKWFINDPELALLMATAKEAEQDG